MFGGKGVVSDKGPLTILAEPIAQMADEHFNAPPLRKNQNRAEWGAGLLAVKTRRTATPPRKPPTTLI